MTTVARYDAIITVTTTAIYTAVGRDASPSIAVTPGESTTIYDGTTVIASSSPFISYWTSVYSGTPWASSWSTAWSTGYSTEAGTAISSETASTVAVSFATTASSATSATASAPSGVAVMPPTSCPADNGTAISVVQNGYVYTYLELCDTDVPDANETSVYRSGESACVASCTTANSGNATMCTGATFSGTIDSNGNNCYLKSTTTYQSVYQSGWATYWYISKSQIMGGSPGGASGGASASTVVGDSTITSSPSAGATAAMSSAVSNSAPPVTMPPDYGNSSTSNNYSSTWYSQYGTSFQTVYATSTIVYQVATTSYVVISETTVSSSSYNNSSSGAIGGNAGAVAGESIPYSNASATTSSPIPTFSPSSGGRNGNYSAGASGGAAGGINGSVISGASGPFGPSTASPSSTVSYINGTIGGSSGGINGSVLSGASGGYPGPKTSPSPFSPGFSGAPRTGTFATSRSSLITPAPSPSAPYVNGTAGGALGGNNGTIISDAIGGYPNATNSTSPSTSYPFGSSPRTGTELTISSGSTTPTPSYGTPPAYGVPPIGGFPGAPATPVYPVNGTNITPYLTGGTGINFVFPFSFQLLVYFISHVEDRYTAWTRKSDAELPIFVLYYWMD